MQYAMIKTNESKLLIDASEVLVLDYVLQKENFDVFKSVIDNNPDEELLSHEALFYGAFKTFEDPLKMTSFVKDMVNYGLVKFNFECKEIPFKKWTSDNIETSVEYSVIKDIVIYDNISNGSNTIPFACYLRSQENLDNKSKFGSTFFPKLQFKENKEPDVFTSFLNRPGLFCFHTEEKRKKGKINMENWKDFIDKDRAINVALKIK